MRARVDQRRSHRSASSRKLAAKIARETPSDGELLDIALGLMEIHAKRTGHLTTGGAA